MYLLSGCSSLAQSSNPCHCKASEALFSIVRRHDLVSLILQECSQEFDDRVFVINNQNRRQGCRPCLGVLSAANADEAPDGATG